MPYTFEEITPQDPYIVELPHIIDMTTVSNLIHLYQPIIGTEAISLYLTFTYQVSQLRGLSEQSLHRQLMSQLNLSLPAIIKARKLLEAVGLLKTTRYANREKDEHLFYYKISMPLDSFQFFQSDILSVLLLNRIGKSNFQSLQKKLSPSFEWNQQQLYYEETNMTKSFDEVFDSILASELKITPGSELEEWIKPFQKIEKNSLKIKHKYLDMDYIKGMVSNLYQLDKILDQKTINLLQELAFLYQLSEMDIINILKDNALYEHNGKIGEKELRTKMREKYQLEQKDVVLLEKDNKKSAPKENTTPKTDDKSKRHQWMLENFTPIDLMKQYQGGSKIPDADLSLIEALLYDYQLNAGVVNVLIEYVMLSNDYKLPKNLTEKIAGHWKRSKIETVIDALNLAKKEHQLYKGWTDSTKTKEKKVPTRKTNNTKKEHVPDYILKQQQTYHQKSTNKQGKDKDQIDQDKQQRINQLLKDLGEI